MRILATIAFSFSASLLALSLLTYGSWALWAAGGLLLLSVLSFFIPKSAKAKPRLLLISVSMALGLLYGLVWNALIARPVQMQCGAAASFSGIVSDWPESTSSGYRVTVRLSDARVKAICYCDDASMADLEPGQLLQGNAYWQDASSIHDTDVTTFTSRGVFVLLYCRGTPAVSSGSAGSLRYLPQRTSKAMGEKIREIWSDSTVCALLQAELLGDRSGISDTLSNQFSEAGVSHLFAVSGLHCAFLITLLSLFIGPQHRRLLALCGISVLLFYMILVGLTPSVVRACVMQIFLLLAPLFFREADAPTSLGAALLLLLLLNPYAIAGVSLQLSFGAMLGMLLLTPRLYTYFRGKCKVCRKLLLWLLSALLGTVSATVGAMVFTVPLTVCYFGVLPILSPLSSLLTVPIASCNFMAGFLTVLVGFLWLPGAKVLGIVSALLSKLFLLVVQQITSIPYHALYTDGTYLVYWLVFVYALFLFCACTRDRKRKYALAAIISALSLVLCVTLRIAEFRSGSLTAVAVDVGQGESILLTSQGKTVLVDCGSSNSNEKAARQVLAQLNSMGEDRLDAVAVTHYHADHTNGLYELLERVRVDTLYLPQIEDEYGVKDRLLSLAKDKNIPIIFVEDITHIPLGNATVTAFPPVGSGDLNEEGLALLCTSGDFDLLVTGDMSGKTEQALTETYPLPDIEVLLVSHHGSKYSSQRSFLETVLPDAAIISVGSNRYGHPTDAALSRLQAAGATVYRTDYQGNITVTVQ